MVSKQGGIIYSAVCWKCRINMGNYRDLGVNWYKSGCLQDNGSGVNVRVDYPAKNWEWKCYNILVNKPTLSMYDNIHFNALNYLNDYLYIKFDPLVKYPRFFTF